MPELYDVIVLGGGPAGLAAGLRLHRFGHRVLVLERTRYERPRAGETFGGELGPLLEDLGFWDDFVAAGPVPFRGVQSAWGSAELGERASIFHPFGEGWHVDRRQFDQLLATGARRAGLQVELGAGTSGLAREDGLWRVQPPTGALSGTTVTTRLLVDASGRGAPATAPHLVERRWLQADREVAVVGAMTAPALPLEPVLVLEAAAEGWWYSVPQHDGALLVVLITDADLLPVRGPAALAKHFLARLAATTHSAARAAGATLSTPPWIARADSGLLLPDRQPGWRALGDAAHSADPLGGDGVVRALRSAEEAAADLHAELLGAPQPLQKGLPLRDRFRGYVELRDRYCAGEGRFPDAPFWVRRRPLDWQRAPLLLDPRTVLRWDGAPLATDVSAPVEALLSCDGLEDVLGLLRAPTPAHRALAHLGALVPFEPKRLLIGLQLLHALGGIRAEA